MIQLIRVLQPVRRFLQRIALRSSRKEVVHGLPVVNWILHEEDQAGLMAVYAALELVWQTDSRRYRRMVRDLDYVIVTNTPGSAGEYWPDIRSMLIDARNAVRQVREATAMVIIHEATHARLWSRGVGRFRDRARIEGVCIRAEIEFVRKIPGTGHLVKGAQMKLESRYWEVPRTQSVNSWYNQQGWPRWLRRVLGIPV